MFLLVRLPLDTALYFRDFAKCAADGNEYQYAAVHLLAYLIVGDLANARLLWRRLSPSCKMDADTTAAWGLGQALWLGDRGRLYSLAAAHQWSSTATKLVLHLVCSGRTATFRLVSRAYTTIQVDKLATMIGLSESDTLHVCSQAGWKVEGEFAVPSGIPTSFRLDISVVVGGKEFTVTELAESDHFKFGELSNSDNTSTDRSLSGLEALTEQLVRLQAA